jgi:uncharacterized protein YndB with AHSA1/START domain
MANHYKPSPLAEVTVHGKENEWVLTFVRDFRHPPAKVWAALTDPAQLSQWAPFNTPHDLARTGETTLTMVDGEAEIELAANVLRAEEPRLLEYTWGDDLLRWELTETAEGTRLTLHHTMADRQWLPKVCTGWHICLDVAAHLLDGEPVGVIRGSEAKRYGFDELADAYSRELGG